ncbi:hypothetical protein WGW30_08645, partial [Campylobacter jejuni]
NEVDKIIKERDEKLEDIVFVNAIYCLQKTKSLECGIQPKLNKIKEYDAIIKIDQDKIKDYIEDYIEVSKDEIDLQIEYMKKNLVY